MRFLQPDLVSWFLAIPLAFAFWFLYVRAKQLFRQRAAIGPHLQGISRLSTSARDIATLVAAVLAVGSRLVDFDSVQGRLPGGVPGCRARHLFPGIKL